MPQPLPLQEVRTHQTWTLQPTSCSVPNSFRNQISTGSMLLRILTWLDFAGCAVFAFFATSLPIQYYFINSNEAHTSDFAIGWFWMTIFGAVPAIVLIGLVYRQRKIAPQWLSALWLLPTLPVLASAIFWLYLAMQA